MQGRHPIDIRRVDIGALIEQTADLLLVPASASGQKYATVGELDLSHLVRAIFR